MSDASMGKSAEKVLWVDYAKGVCILLVVMMHSTLGVGEAFGREGFMHAVVDFVQPFRIPAFFLTAGLFLGRTIDRPWPDYLDKKVVHFAYFYVLWLAINSVVKFAAAGPAAVAQTFLVGLVDPFGTLWFIYVLPLFFIAARLGRNAPLALVVVAAILEVAPVRTGAYAVDQFAAYFIYFVAGYLGAAQAFALADWAMRRRAAALGALCAWLALHVALRSVDLFDRPLIGAPGVALLAGLLGAGAVIVASALLAERRLLGFIAYCGARTLPIYLAFFLPMAATRAVLVRLAPGMDVGLASAIVWIVAVSTSLAFYEIVKGTRLGFLFARPEPLRAPARA